jgi:4-diphosphocytidyl-2-C-methyl-D-erythritol kinase
MAEGAAGGEPGATVRRRAHGKVNLALAVGRAIEEGERAGMHPIASWAAPVDLADDLWLTRLADDRFSRYAIRWSDGAPQRSAEIDWSVRDDLAVRAHLLLEEHAGRTLPVQMRVDKRVPVGAGMGGGSSDAAAVLVGCDELFGLGLSENTLVRLAARLGSDVPFFLRAQGDAGGHALIGGLGDELETVPAASADLVLILPSFGCPTEAVYHAFDERFDDADVEGGSGASHEFRVEEVRALAGGGLVEHGRLFNDLAGPAERVRPRLASLRGEVERLIGLTPHVTGSGSGLFVVCKGGAVEAGLLAEQLVKVLEGCAVVASRLV